MLRYPIVIDYSMTLKEMVALGKYDYVSPEINSENLKIKGVGKQERVVSIFTLKQKLCHLDTLQEIEKHGFRRAGIEELLAFGATYPDIQRHCLIVALGAIFSCPDDYARVCILGGDKKSRRSLFIYWTECGWHENDHLLVIPNQ